jgi:hypothetical protein
MTEHEMEDLLWNYPDLLLNEPLTQYRRQAASLVSRADLVFVDRIDRLLVIEVKKGVLPRGAIPQVMDHYGSMKTQHPDRSVEMMVVANQIPSERKATLESLHIDWREIPEYRFRSLAEQKGYVFASENDIQVSSPARISDNTSLGLHPQGARCAPVLGTEIRQSSAVETKTERTARKIREGNPTTESLCVLRVLASDISKPWPMPEIAGGMHEQLRENGLPYESTRYNETCAALDIAGLIESVPDRGGPALLRRITAAGVSYLRQFDDSRGKLPPASRV